MSASSAAKRDREKAKRARAEHKRERRQTRSAEQAEGAEGVEVERAAPVKLESDVLAALAALHEAHLAERIGFDDFEVAKAELLSQLRV